MFLEKGEDCIKTLLQRAKGSSLEISIDPDVPIRDIRLLSPHSQRIRCLEFTRNYWHSIAEFSEVNPGPLPHLRTLKVSWDEADDDDEFAAIAATPPSSMFFANAPNVEEFSFRSTRFKFLNYFFFPNLTTFTLWTLEVTRSRASDLFDFLQASPMLRTVRMWISGIMLEGIPQQMIILPDVETFSLTSDCDNAYDLALHMSCPRARNVSLTCEVSELDVTSNWRIFPTSTPWNTIVHQYTRSPVEEVTLEIRPPDHISSLTFRSSDTSSIRLGFFLTDDCWDELYIDSGEVVYEVLRQGFETIQTHPLLPNIKRLHTIFRDLDSYSFLSPSPATEIRTLLERVGPLDELTISGCNLHPYLAGFGELYKSEKPIVFPPIKLLTILHPWMETDEEECMDAIAELAKSQHARGIPFERVTVRANGLPVGMAERLRQWVGVVDCCDENSPVGGY